MSQGSGVWYDRGVRGGCTRGKIGFSEKETMSTQGRHRAMWSGTTGGCRVGVPGEKLELSVRPTGHILALHRHSGQAIVGEKWYNHGHTGHTVCDALDTDTLGMYQILTVPPLVPTPHACTRY